MEKGGRRGNMHVFECARACNLFWFALYCKYKGPHSTSFFHNFNPLITAATPTTTTADTLDALVFFELRFGHATDTGGVEVCFFGLDAAEAAELHKQIRL